MQKKDVKSVLEKIRSDVYTFDEETIAKYWLHKLNRNLQSGYSDDSLERVSDEMWAYLMKEQANQPAKRMRLWPRIVVAAAVAAMIFGIWFYQNGITPLPNAKFKDQMVKSDVAPGNVGATLTLASGKKINLSNAANGEIAKESGISVTKTKDGALVYQIGKSTGAANKYNTLTTARGETYILSLPDKSKVWMNAASSLTYSTSLNDRGRRKVKLEGEAYFEIFKDKTHPFIVETNDQEVEVLGTHFNINSYADEPTVKTTLLEGSVCVWPLKGKAGSKILKPGQQSTLSPDHPIIIKAVNTEDVIAWKNGLFVFEGDRLENIMSQISRWYNVDVQYADRSVLNETYSGTVTRFANISIVLKRLEITGNVKFKIAGRRIVVGR